MRHTLPSVFLICVGTIANAQSFSYSSQARTVTAAYQEAGQPSSVVDTITAPGFGPFDARADVGLGFAHQVSSLTPSRIDYLAELRMDPAPFIIGSVSESLLDVRFTLSSSTRVLLDIERINNLGIGIVRLTGPVGFQFSQPISLEIPLVAGQYRFEIINSVAATGFTSQFAEVRLIVPGPGTTCFALACGVLVSRRRRGS